MMSWFLGIFVFLCVFFLFISFLLVVACLRASRRIQLWENLFMDSIEDVQEAKNIFDALLRRNVMLAEDTDIKKIQQVFAVVSDILGDYLLDGKELTKGKQRK